MGIKEFITVRTAASEIGLKPRALQHMCKEGKIPASRMGRMYLIDRRKWEEWKARNIVAA